MTAVLPPPLPVPTSSLAFVSRKDLGWQVSVRSTESVRCGVEHMATKLGRIAEHRCELAGVHHQDNRVGRSRYRGHATATGQQRQLARYFATADTTGEVVALDMKVAIDDYEALPAVCVARAMTSSPAATLTDVASLLKRMSSARGSMSFRALSLRMAAGLGRMNMTCSFGGVRQVDLRGVSGSCAPYCAPVNSHRARRHPGPTIGL